MKTQKSYSIIGLMSGTSMDGIDASFVRTNGVTLERLGIDFFQKYSKETSQALSIASEKPKQFLSDIKNLERINLLITRDHYNIVKKMIYNKNIYPDYIGFHGQTLFHNAQQNISIQLGNPQLLANTLGIGVISNFRENDIKHKGQGAPLAPVYHKFLIQSLGLDLPSCFLNIGGIANLTYYDDNNLIGFDTGPGNVLIDKYCQTFLNLNFDNDGELGRQGTVNQILLNKFMKNSFFKKNFPKSLDKLDFENISNEIRNYNMKDFDIIATLTEMTVISIKISIKMLPHTPLNLIISGGGQNNNYLTDRLKENFNFTVKTANEVGLPGDYLEAELIAFLTARNLNELPYTFPKTTGVKSPLLGGTKFTPNY